MSNQEVINIAAVLFNFGGFVITSILYHSERKRHRETKRQLVQTMIECEIRSSERDYWHVRAVNG
jgi:hypothetical protein